ncbi:MAG: acyl-CoA carboxylase subunit beta [Roseburia sp.]|nr:acyl-CoA carboxylase subunit beta [Roseburia sp.]
MEYNIEQQHKKGRLHAIERIQALLDENTFHEIQKGVTNHQEGYGIETKQFPYDGVICGYGYINGRKVFLYAQDFTVLGGTLGHEHGLKIVNMIKKAVENKCPLIGIVDSGGARIQEGVYSLAGYGEMFFSQTMASGYIPQICIIAGTSAGGSAYSPGLSDFVFMIDQQSNMFITGPKVVESVTGQKVNMEDLGGARMHATKSGVAHFMCKNEQDCYEKVRKLLDYIPHCYEEGGREEIAQIEKMRRGTIDMDSYRIVLPNNRRQIYEVKDVLKKIFDEDSIFEVHGDYAKNMVVYFAKLGGIHVGVVANNPAYMGVIDSNASDKAARFIRYCDCYNIPIITFVDTPGFMPGLDQEQMGIVRHGAKVLYAYAEATTIKLTVIMRKAYGGAYIAMCSKHLGADFVYAWPQAEIAVMGSEGAVQILYAKEIKYMSPGERSDFLEAKEEEYETKVMNADIAVQYGYVDAMLEPDDTREQLISDILVLRDKTGLYNVKKKHGNMPM